MNGPIAQIAALVCHGNAALRGIGHPRFFPGNSTCRFCDSVIFVDSHPAEAGGMKERPVASTPDDWFYLIKRQGIRELRLGHTRSADGPLADRVSAAHAGGGGQWCIKASGADSARDIWVSRWEVWNRDAPESRIWRVTYTNLGKDGAPTGDATDLHGAAGRLRDSLVRIADFAVTHDCPNFARRFDGGLRILETGDAADVYHTDLAPVGAVPEAAAVLLAACQKAWVFGGMGSWNDLAFGGEDQKEYERVSETLFRSVNSAIIAASNASIAVSPS